MNKYLKFFLLGFLFLQTQAMAQSSDPVLGIWKTMDEKTNQPASLIKIEEVHGQLTGTVLALMESPGETLVTHCHLCKDERRGKPIVGMVIMKGLKKDKLGYWSGGEILDPEEGDIYRVKIETDDGKILRVRGYIGFSLIGRTQHWVR